MESFLGAVLTSMTSLETFRLCHAADLGFVVAGTPKGECICSVVAGRRKGSAFLMM